MITWKQTLLSVLLIANKMAFQMINVWIDMKFARADLDCSPIMNLLIIVTGPKGFAREQKHRTTPQTGELYELCNLIHLLNN